MIIRSINAQFSVRKLPIELVKAKGYCYLVFDNGSKYDTRSVMVPRVNDLSLGEWLTEAQDFAKAMGHGTV